jgi:hypothetical protein
MTELDTSLFVIGDDITFEQCVYAVGCGDNYFVYTMRDFNNNPIYVGKTNDFMQRWKRHCKTKSWITEVYIVEVRVYGSHSEALFVESQAILHYLPVYNTAGKSGVLSKIKIPYKYKFNLTTSFNQ